MAIVRSRFLPCIAPRRVCLLDCLVDVSYLGQQTDSRQKVQPYFGRMNAQEQQPSDLHVASVAV